MRADKIKFISISQILAFKLVLDDCVVEYKYKF